MRILFLLPTLFFLFHACKEKDKGPISERKFTELYLDSLKGRFPGFNYNIKEDLTIEAGVDSNQFTHYLHNAYSSYKNDPDSLVAVIQHYLNRIGTLYDGEQPVSKDKIIAVIKDYNYPAEIAATMKGDDPAAPVSELVYEKYNEKLIILYGEDSEDGISYFTRDQFKEIGLPEDSLLPLAMRNLDSLLKNVERNGDDGVFMVTAGGTYEASLVLAKNLWTKETFPVTGEIVISIPTRDLLLVTGSKDTKGIQKVREMASEAWKNGPYQLLPDLFIWNGKKFEPFQ